MIPTKPPPTFKHPEKWSADMKDFVSKCLVKNPEERLSATSLLLVIKISFLIIIVTISYQRCT